MSKLLLIIGIPGSGKSTLAEKIKQTDQQFKNANIWEADMYFIDSDGNYNWNVEYLRNAHQWCQFKVELDMQRRRNVIVSNTNLTPKQRKPYIDLAKKYMYDVQVIACDGQFQNIHNVPEETLKNMRRRFVPFNEGELE